MVIGGLQYGATGGAGRVFISGISKCSRALMVLRLMVGCLSSPVVRSSFVGFLLSILKVGPFGRVEARAKKRRRACFRRLSSKGMLASMCMLSIGDVQYAPVMILKAWFWMVWSESIFLEAISSNKKPL